MRKGLFLVLMTAIFSIAAVAQYAPNDVSDLVGSRASSGESALRSRGYSNVRGNKSNNRVFTYWWNGGRSACILVTTYDGRYESIVGTNASECGQNNNNGGGWGSGGGWNGNKQNPPSWARGTFYGTAPNGTQIQLTISNDGAVSANIGGSMSYGGYSNGNIYINGNSSRLERDGNGFQTVSNSNGERIYYGRNNWGSGGGNNGGGWGGGNTGSRPPSWARGTFYGTAPNGTQIMLTINDSGAVTATIGGSPNYGTYSNGNLIINGQTSRVERVSNGIVTVSNSNGERIYYSINSWGSGNSGGGTAPAININDLIGFRSAAGDREARNRGFRIVDTTVDGNRMLKTMWRDSSKQCLQVTVVDDLYLHIYDIQSHRKCK